MRAAARMSTVVHGGQDKLWGTSTSSGSKLHAVSRLHSAPGVASASASGRLQQLYEVVREKLRAGPIRTKEDAQEVSAALSNVSLDELGLDADLVQAASRGDGDGSGFLALRSRLLPRRSNRAESVTYLDIYSDEDGPLTPTSMTIGIFSLPAGAGIPLHNHPDMTVFSRLLYGKLHVRAYDLVDPEDPAAQALKQSLPPAALRGGAVRAARLVADKQLTAPADNMVLFPSSGGNIHSFNAVSACAILDVLTPPYAPGAGRDCTYFREIKPARSIVSNTQQEQDEQQGLVGLQECLPPADFQVLTGVYRGFQVKSPDS